MVASKNALKSEDWKKRYPGWTFVKRKPQFLVKGKRYAWMLQGKGINVLSVLTQPIVNDCLEHDEGGITRDGVTILFDASKLIVHDRAQQFLYYIILNFIEMVSGKAPGELTDREREVTMSFADIAEAFGLKYHGAKKMAVLATRTLYNLSVEWTEKVVVQEEKKKLRKVRSFAMRFLEDMRREETFEVCGEEPGFSLLVRGAITVMLTARFANYLLSNAHKMRFPVALFKISPQYEPNAFSFGLKIALHYRMNQDKERSNLIEIVTLIRSSGGMAPYEVVQRTRQFRRMIVIPFERALDHLVKYGVLKTWYYVDPVLGRLDGRMDVGVNHNRFFSLDIYFELNDYPGCHESAEESNPKESVPVEVVKIEKIPSVSKTFSVFDC